MLGASAPAHPENKTFLVNFSNNWKTGLDMVKRGSGFMFPFEIVAKNELQQNEAALSIVDLVQLPKAMGGGLSSVPKGSGEEDLTCTKSVEHAKVSVFLQGLE